MRKLTPLVPAEYLEQALAEIVAPKSQDATVRQMTRSRLTASASRVSGEK